MLVGETRASTAKDERGDEERRIAVIKKRISSSYDSVCAAFPGIPLVQLHSRLLRVSHLATRHDPVE
jgi:hypothetical protein